MATLRVSKTLADLGIAKEMSLSSPVIKWHPFGQPLGNIEDLKLRKMKIECKVKFSKKGWEALRKVSSRIIKIGLSEKLPRVKKGEKVTLHMDGPLESRDVTGILYHVRKPHADSESRIYYIREEFSGIPKAV